LKILIIKFSSIGDIILSTSPLKSVRLTYPKAKIDFLTLDTFAPLLEGHSDIDELIVLKKSAKYRQIKRTGKYFHDKQYDLVIDLHNTLRAKIICRQIRNAPKYILKKPRWNRFKLFYLFKNNFDPNFSQIHLLHSPINHLLQSNGKYPPTHLTISEIERKSVLKTFDLSDNYVTIIPGAAWPQKRWLVENYISIIKKLIDNNIGVVILGGNNDSICEDLSYTHHHVIDLHGKTSLRESLAIIANAKCALGSDTGLLHGAESLKIPVVMILGPTSRETGGGTNLPESITVEDNTLWCRPCSQNGKRKCYRKKQFCMTNLSVETIWIELKRILDI